MEVEQASFAHAIARCYLAILSIEHDYLTEKLDLEAVAIYCIAGKFGGSS